MRPASVKITPWLERMISCTSSSFSSLVIAVLTAGSVSYTHLDVYKRQPHTFNDEIIENIGMLPAIPCYGSQQPDTAKDLMIAAWERICDYQSKVLNYCATEAGFEVIYSHIHNVDHMGHKFWHHAKPRGNTPEAMARAEAYQECIREVYRQTDRYLGSFLHLLDEDWSVFIMSDHGLMVMDCLLYTSRCV